MMMKKRYEIPTAVYALIYDENKILLQKRNHTGIEDGAFDLATSGHVEAGETYVDAIVRELREELGIQVLPEDIEFSNTIHSKYHDDGLVYNNVYFKIKRYRGTPAVMEPSKNAGLEWFDLQTLPDNLIADRRLGIENDLKHQAFAEFGWA